MTRLYQRLCTGDRSVTVARLSTRHLKGADETAIEQDEDMAGKYHVMGRSIAGSFFIECLLRQAGVDYDFTHVARKQHNTPEFLAANPLGRIPVLVTPDGHHIIETMAIFTHLVEAFPVLAPAIGDPRRDRMWQHLAVLGTSLYTSFHRYHHSHYVGPEEMFDTIRAYAMKDTARWLDYLETQLDPYLAGAEPMAADFYFFMMTRWAPDSEMVTSGRPKVAAFVDAMRYHPTVEAVNQDRGRPSGS